MPDCPTPRPTRLRSVAIATLGAFLLTAAAIAPTAAQADPMGAPGALEVTREGARAHGLAALRAGRPDVAASIAEALISVEPTDPFAHYLLAHARLAQGQNRPAEAAARETLRHATNDQQRFQANRVIALAAYNDNRYTTAQLRLRRASDFASAPADVSRTRAEFAATRARNPWNLQLSFSAGPSSNVNSGSSSEFNYVEGVVEQSIGVHRYEARALSGFVIDSGADLGYRLRGDATSQTRLTFRAGLRHARLDSNARAQWDADTAYYTEILDAIDDPVLRALLDPTRPFPEVMSRLRIEAGVQHAFALTPRTRTTLSASLGQEWTNAGQIAPLARAAVGLEHALSDGDTLLAGLTADMRRDGLQNDTRNTLTIHAGLRTRIANGDRLGATLFAARHVAPGAGASGNSGGLALDYAMAQRVGPAEVSANLTLSHSDYPGYINLLTPAPGGRQAQSASAALTLGFPDLGVMRFTPTLTLHAQQTRSNVSRYNSAQSSVSIGLRSQF